MPSCSAASMPISICPSLHWTFTCSKKTKRSNPVVNFTARFRSRDAHSGTYLFEGGLAWFCSVQTRGRLVDQSRQCKTHMQHSDLVQKCILRRGFNGNLVWPVTRGSRSEHQGHPAVHSLYGGSCVEHPPCKHCAATIVGPGARRTSIDSNHVSTAPTTLQQCTSLLPRLQDPQWRNTLCHSRE